MRKSARCTAQISVLSASTKQENHQRNLLSTTDVDKSWFSAKRWGNIFLSSRNYLNSVAEALAQQHQEKHVQYRVDDKLGTV